MRYRQLLLNILAKKPHLKPSVRNFLNSKDQEYESKEIVDWIFANNINKAIDNLLLKYENYPSFQEKLKLMLESKIDPYTAFSSQPQEFYSYEDKIIKSYFLISYPDYVQSKICLNEAITMCPLRPEAYVLRGNLYTNFNEYPQAETDYNEALKLKPDWALQVCKAKGRMLEKQNKFDEAIFLYDQLLKNHPNYLSIIFNKANCLGFKKEYQLAIEECDKILNINPSDAYVYYNKGLFLYLMNDKAEAIKNFDKAIELKADDHNFYYHRGNVFSDNQNYEAAVINYRKALQLQSDHYPSANNLRISLNKLSQIRLNSNSSTVFSQKNYYQSSSKIPDSSSVIGMSKL